MFLSVLTHFLQLQVTVLAVVCFVAVGFLYNGQAMGLLYFLLLLLRCLYAYLFLSSLVSCCGMMLSILSNWQDQLINAAEWAGEMAGARKILTQP